MTREMEDIKKDMHRIPEMENTVTEMKIPCVWLTTYYTLQNNNNKKSEIEDIAIETIQNEAQRGTRLK